MEMSETSIIFNTGADVHVTNNPDLFIATEPPEYSDVIGIEGSAIKARVGSLLCLGKCLFNLQTALSHWHHPTYWSHYLISSILMERCTRYMYHRQFH